MTTAIGVAVASRLPARPDSETFATARHDGHNRVVADGGITVGSGTSGEGIDAMRRIGTIAW